MRGERAVRTASRAARRSLTGIAVAAGAVVGFPGAAALGAQSSCPEKLPIAFSLGDDAVIDARSAVLLDGDVVLFGQHPRRALRNGGVASVDSLIAGLRLSFGREGPAVLHSVPLPRANLRVESAKAVRLGADDLRVFFRGAANDSLGTAAPFTLWTARLVRGAWEDVIRVGRFVDPHLVAAELTDAVVRFEGWDIFAFMQHHPPQASELVTVWVKGDSLTIQRSSVDLEVGDYVSLVAHEGGLHVALIGTRRADAVAVATTRFHDLWIARLSRVGLSDYRRLAIGEHRALSEPRLLGSKEGLVVAFSVREGSADALHWRSATDASLREHRLPGRWPLTRPSEPFADLLVFPDTEPSAQILQLTPQGHRVLATVPSLGAAPALAGWGDRLFAASIVPRAGARSAEVAVIDIACAVRAARR